MGHLNGCPRSIRETCIIGAKELIKNGIYKEAKMKLLGHVLSAEDTETGELHAMLAGFIDDDDGFVLGLS